MDNNKRSSTSLAWLVVILFSTAMFGCGGSSDNAVVATDVTAPTVFASLPSNAASGTALNKNITVTFSEAMDATTITATSFSVMQGVTAVPGSVTYADKVATFNPTSDLLAGTVYTATLSTAVKDAAGNALASSKVWSFTTGTTADLIAPTVLSVVPADAATAVVLNTNVSATFSEDIDASTLTASSFTLMHGSTAVSGVLSYLSGTATLNPASDLLNSTSYTATLSTAVKDLAGNAMASSKVWSFTTSSAPVVVSASVAPVLLGTAVNYAILAKTGVSTVPTSVVTGNVGVSPVARTYLTGWSETMAADASDMYSTSVQVRSPFKLYASDYAVPAPSDLGTAVLDMGTAYTDAAGRTATSAATTNVGAGTLTSLTLTPGVYEWGSNVTIPTDLTLNGTATDVWIFKVAGTLEMAAAKNVILSGGALPQNIFWQASGAVSIGANTHFEGIILGWTSITFGNLSSINGRLLAQTAVALDATTVTQP
jgi:hypothetical protein